jgi:hypothetical protein
MAIEGETIQIRVTIPGGFQHHGIQYSEGDVSTETLQDGDYFIRAGWAEDTAGTVVHPKPALTDVVLYVNDIINEVPVSEVV